MSKLMPTVYRHAIIDSKNGNAFVVAGYTPTREAGHWGDVTKKDRAVLMESAVAIVTHTKGTIVAKNLIKDKECCTYRWRLVEKIRKVLENGGEGLVTLKADFEMFKRDTLEPQLKDEGTTRKGATASKKSAKPTTTKKRSPHRGPATQQKTVLSPEAADKDFDPNNEKDERERIQRTLVQRRGQKRFRDSLISTYEGKCVITGCSILDILEAAHIVPYRGYHTNKTSNGLLLRADLHTLFDCNLLAIDPETMEVLLAPYIRNSEYKNWYGHHIRMPKNTEGQPNKEALSRHLEDCRNTWEKGTTD